jgi:hypothetical protein
MVFRTPVRRIFRSYDAWRQHPMLADGRKDPLPNLKQAFGIFVGLVAVDWVWGTVFGEYRTTHERWGACMHG